MLKGPSLKEEKLAWKKGFKMVAGLDEAGRGPLAGPVVAGAVAISPDFKFDIADFAGLNDSKKLSEKQREFFYAKLTENKDILWGAGVVDEKTIDKINILQATKLAMRLAIENLAEKPDFLLIDGNFTLKDLDVSQKAIIGGDAKVFSIAAASIIAKVTRDRIMQKYHVEYPNYAFDRHKGYGTAAHYAAIEKNGICPIHRKSFLGKIIHNI